MIRGERLIPRPQYNKHAESLNKSPTERRPPKPQTGRSLRRSDTRRSL